MPDAAGPVKLLRCGPVARIRLNRPAVLNALDQAMVEGLLAAVEAIAASSELRVVVLQGEGRSFMAGGDIAQFQRAGPDAPAMVRRLIVPFHQAVEQLAGLPIPVLASVQGAVAGAGVSVMLAADLAIAADDLRLSLAYARIGASPDGSSTWSLPRVVGLRKALEIGLLGNELDAAEALRLGLVNRVVPAAALERETDALARRLADGPTQAYGRIKALMRASLDRTLPEQLAAEAEAFVASAGTADFAEGATAFMAKRAPRFTGA